MPNPKFLALSSSLYSIILSAVVSVCFSSISLADSTCPSRALWTNSEYARNSAATPDGTLSFHITGKYDDCSDDFKSISCVQHIEKTKCIAYGGRASAVLCYVRFSGRVLNESFPRNLYYPEWGYNAGFSCGFLGFGNCHSTVPKGFKAGFSQEIAELKHKPKCQ
jgi:hypothetical protein